MWTTLAFHRQFHTDLVKAMSDYPFPKPAGKWHELKVVNNPFPRAIAGAGADSRRPARPSLFCRDHLQPMERGGEGQDVDHARISSPVPHRPGEGDERLSVPEARRKVARTESRS